MHVLRPWTRGGRPAVGLCRRGRGATPRRPSGPASGAPWKAARRREARAAGCSSQQRHPATGPLGPVPEAAAASRARRAATCRRRGGAADRLGQQTVSRSAAEPIGSLKHDAEHGGRSAGRPQGWRGWAGAVSRGGGACAGAGRGSPGTWQLTAARAAAAVDAIASVRCLRAPGHLRQAREDHASSASSSAGVRGGAAAPPAPVQREAARAPGSTATSTRTAERRLSAASRHEAALGRRSQRGEALDGDAAAVAVSARAAIAREKLRLPP